MALRHEVRRGTHLELLVHRKPRLGRALVLLPLFLHGSSGFAVRLRPLFVLLQKPLLLALEHDEDRCVLLPFLLCTQGSNAEVTKAWTITFLAFLDRSLEKIKW